jgi:type III restriction enzyme
VTRQVIENPIINRPYDMPSRHWKFDDNGLVVPETIDGRRPSESWIPIPQPTKGKKDFFQPTLDDVPFERRKPNDQVELVRSAVDAWRRGGYQAVTTTSRRLLEYWSDPDRDNRILFCQREAVETAIYLAEAAPKLGAHWLRTALDDQNREYNAGLPRVAFKMATGSGKTIVMGMLIAWQTLNKVAKPQDNRFAKRFLIVTPGITIRDRLRVLLPSDDQNYYKLRDLVPADLWGPLRQAEIVITNYHSFLLRTTKEGAGITTNTKLLLTAGKSEDPFTETPDQMVNRVLRPFSGKGSEIVVLNDEAHHCYLGRATGSAEVPAAKDLTAEEKAEQKEREKEARVWFAGLQFIKRKIGIKTIYDLSATPFFLKGSGYSEGFLFPWVVSDFSLIDAIEAGIVKIPRVPVDDNATVKDVVYLNLWPKVSAHLPRRLPKSVQAVGAPLPAALEGAIRSLYDNYEKAFRRWEQSDAVARGETPPVFIVVCNNTTVSKMVYDFIAGYTKLTEPREVHVKGELPLVSNYEGEHQLARPRTILVDSVQLESGEAMSPEFKKAAADEIEVFRSEYAQRTGRSGDELEDVDILREVMNTVGKKDRLGEDVRCVVSVSMLTEGWDANTVTHILGIRAFGSQLLCEQVVGRGLRRRSYAVNDDGYFEPEYAEIYGVPFSFIRTEPGSGDIKKPARNPVRVRAVPERQESRITFPKLEGYRVELPDEQLDVDFDDEHRFHLTLDEVPTRTETGWLVGEQQTHQLDDLRHVRTQEVAFRIARRMMHRYVDLGGQSELIHDAHGQPKRWLYPDLVGICKQWLDEMVTYDDGTFPGLFRITELEALAAERINQALFKVVGARRERILPIFQRFDPDGSTDDIDFFTTKQVYETDPKKCAVNFVVLDGRDGNTWEQIVAQTLEALPEVEAYVKNDHLEFGIPYVHAGRTRRYIPDFLVRLVRRPGDQVRHLIVEVSGTLKSQAMTQEKAETARNLWCAAVNNHDGEWGRWGFVEIKSPFAAKHALQDAIAALYGDGPITGLLS